jgi:hypothetical protein
LGGAIKTRVEAAGPCPNSLAAATEQLYTCWAVKPSTGSCSGTIAEERCHCPTVAPLVVSLMLRM